MPKKALLSMKKLLDAFWQKRATNLILTTGAPPTLKLANKLEAIGEKPLSPEDIMNLVYVLLLPQQKEKFENGHDLDISFGIAGMSRFRANIFYQRGAVNAVFTLIPFKIPSWKEIGAPKKVLPLFDSKNGLVIITGLPGSGKSTIMASLIDYINESYSRYILTIEEPIEYLYRHKKSLTSQRQIGSDAQSWELALNSAFRQSPDVVALSEVRSHANLEYALDIAEKCCLCIILLHAANTISALEQIVKIFPAERREYVRSRLANCFLFAITSKLFLKKKGKGKVAAYEVLTNNAKVSQLIKKGNYTQLKQYLKPSLKSSIAKLKKGGKIS